MDAILKRGLLAWNQFHMRMAQLVSTLSKDPDRKVGAVLVTPDRRQMSVGYNGFPSSLPDNPELLEDKAYKLAHTVHAEDNCLRQAPFSAAGCTLYITRFPCLDCASKIVNAGVKQVVAPRPDFEHPRWGRSWQLAGAKLRHYGVTLTYLELEK